ncbi:MAG: family 1 glycosylhydrolase [Deltaproteobacteria bacterium]|nr:family 1 glycosylhydrolase [Deltaproteobacteria bacterium]
MLRAATLASVAVSVACPLAADARPCSFYGMNPGAPVWGGAVFLDAEVAGAIAGAGAGAIRIDFRLDGAAEWDEAALGTYEGIVDAAVGARLEPLGLVAYEAVSGGQAEWNDDADGDGANDYVDRFASTAVALFERFGDRIKRWEIWNEPNCWSDPGYRDDPQAAGCTYVLPRVYAKILAEVRVRGGDALAAQGAIVVSGGLFAHDIGGSFSDATDYQDEVYAQGPWDWMEENLGRRYPWDVLGYHLYVQQGEAVSAETLAAYLDSVGGLADAWNDSSSLEVTEVGWRTAAVDADLQAANLTTTFQMMAAREDVERVYWFAWRDNPGANLLYGVVDADGNAKPSYDALAAASAGCGDEGPEPGVDSGPEPAIDAGTPGIDAGSEDGVDSGALADSGGALDGAPKSAPDDPGGCGCAAAGGGIETWQVILLAVGLAVRGRGI